MTQSFDLFEALRKDDLETFRSQLLTYGWPKNSEWPDHHLLAEAIKFGRKNVAKFLLDLECRVTKPGNRGTLVHVALTHSDWRDIVLKLIILGAPVSSVNADGDAAVHVAFKSNADGKLIDLLLATYVLETRENRKDSEGLSVLHIACSRPSLLMVQALTYEDTRVIATREDLNGQVQSEYGTGYSRYTPLHFAVKNGHTEIVKFLLQRLNVGIYNGDANSSTPLHLALERGDVEMMDLLLAHDKICEDVANNMGFSHFMAACAGSNTSIVANYLRLSQDLPQTSPQRTINKEVVQFGGSRYRGYSALHFAAEFGRLDTVQLLLAHGASCFVASAENLTPLVLAMKRGHEDICRLLWRRYKAYRQTLCKVIEEEHSRVEVKSRGFVRQRIPMSPSRSGLNGRRQLMSTQVGAKPVAFNNPSKWVSKIPPGFGQLVKIISCQLF